MFDTVTISQNWTRTLLICIELKPNTGDARVEGDLAPRKVISLCPILQQTLLHSENVWKSTCSALFCFLRFRQLDLPAPRQKRILHGTCKWDRVFQMCYAYKLSGHPLEEQLQSPKIVFGFLGLSTPGVSECFLYSQISAFAGYDIHRNTTRNPGRSVTGLWKHSKTALVICHWTLAPW